MLDIHRDAHADEVDQLVTQLDRVRRELLHLGYVDEGSVDQARAIVTDFDDAVGRLRNAAFDRLEGFARRAVKPRGEVGERVRALTRRDTGRQRWEAIGTITSTPHVGVFGVTFDGDSEETGGYWSDRSLTRALVD